MKRFLLFAALAALALLSCKKEIASKSETLYVSSGDSEVTKTNVTLTGTVRSDVLEEATTAGFVLTGTSGKYSSPKVFTCNLAGKAQYSVLLSVENDLEGLHGKRWYYKAFVDLESGRKYGKERSFLTEPIHVTSVSLSPSTSQYNLKVGETVSLAVVVLPDNATDKSFTFASTDSKVASVKSATVNDKPGIKITALDAGSATITVTSTDGKYKASCGVAVRSATAPSGAVDLGLSVYWGTRNLGATSDMDPGTTYNLKRGEDPAYKAKGGHWRLPTWLEYDELYKKCNVTVVTDGTPWSTDETQVQYQGRGIKFTSKTNGNSIIIPVVFQSWKRVYNSSIESWELTYRIQLWTGTWPEENRVDVHQVDLVQRYNPSNGDLGSSNIDHDSNPCMPSNYKFYVRPVAD